MIVPLVCQFGQNGMMSHGPAFLSVLHGFYKVESLSFALHFELDI